MEWRERLDKIVDDQFDSWVRMRRHLHQNPEVSGHERGTSLFLYQQLGDAGLSVRMGPEGRGVLADLALSDHPGSPLIAVRADIDALRIHDAKDVPYRSHCEGVMHACGHDAHSTIMYAAVSSLAQLAAEKSLPWPIRCRAIFQPAEETSEGAREMISVGALENVQAIIASHVDPSRDVGHVGFKPGVLTANCDEMQVLIDGRGGHAARPHEARDPITAAAQLINALYTYIPRVTDSQDAVVVSVCHVQAGDNSNVIPEQVLLRGTMRTLDQGVREQTVNHLQRLAAGIAEVSDTRISVTFGQSSPSVYNHPELIALLRLASEDVVGTAGIDEIPRPSMGSEDFAHYLQHVDGAMVRLGCRSDQRGGMPLHSPEFDVDEEVIRIGARVMARAVVNWWNPQQDLAASI